MSSLFTRSAKSPTERLAALSTPQAPPESAPSVPPAAPPSTTAATAHEHGHRRVGRPRSESSRHAILTAVADLATTLTPAQITIAAITARAGVSKATIYRWWSSRAELLFDALARITVPTLEFPDDADTATALITQLEALQRLFADPCLGRLIIALTVEAQENPDTAQSLRRLWLAPRRESAARILQRGIARGEIRSDVDIEIAIDQLFAPLYHRALYYCGETSVTICGAAKAVEQFLAGAAPHPKHNSPKCNNEGSSGSSIFVRSTATITAEEGTAHE